MLKIYFRPQKKTFFSLEHRPSFKNWWKHIGWKLVTWYFFWYNSIVCTSKQWKEIALSHRSPRLICPRFPLTYLSTLKLVWWWLLQEKNYYLAISTIIFGIMSVCVSNPCLQYLLRRILRHHTTIYWYRYVVTPLLYRIIRFHHLDIILVWLSIIWIYNDWIKKKKPVSLHD